MRDKVSTLSMSLSFSVWFVFSNTTHVNGRAEKSDERVTNCVFGTTQMKEQLCQHTKRNVERMLKVAR